VERTTAAVVGLGAMGRKILSILLERGVPVVAAVDRIEGREGRDAGEYADISRMTGVRVTADPDAVARSGATVAFIATASLVRDVEPLVMSFLDAGASVITTAEEMAYPWRSSPEAARRLDERARERGVAVLGTGINPGFVLDLLVIAMTGVCRSVRSIRATRVNDLSPYGPTVLREQGVGLCPEAFVRGCADGSVSGHVGFEQSIAMISDALGLGVDRIEQERLPIVSAVWREEKGIVVEPGMVAGCRQIGRGYRGGELLVELDHPQQIHPAMEGAATEDRIRIDGEPSMDLLIRPEIPGGVGTAAIAVNSMSPLLACRPGLRTMLDLPAPRLG